MSSTDAGSIDCNTLRLSPEHDPVHSTHLHHLTLTYPWALPLQRVLFSSDC